jgi:hypothetical protein
MHCISPTCNMRYEASQHPVQVVTCHAL